MALFLRDEEVRQIVTMEGMLEAIESMQGHFGRGHAYNLPRRKIIAPGGMLSVMGGGLFYDGVLGVKTYTVVAGTYSFQVSLYDAETGKLLCYTQANRLGQLRTGATSGVAVKYLSNPDSVTVGIIGTGNQASTQLEAVSRVRTVNKVLAYSRNQERREAFAKSTGDSLGISVAAASSNEEAVRGCDIVICIASTMEPVVQGNWLAPGVTVVGAGPTTWRAQEVDSDTLTRADKLFVDSTEQAPQEAGDMAGAVDRGLLQWSQVQELRHAVAGVTPGRDSREQIVYVKLMGTGIADVAAAKLAYDRARTAGVGMEMDW
ncbi:MAG: hypothetical protein BZY88_13335 [SAR202 cluster bacterium Io17-Chloro-G9]|nr:MAG: hypothetical protein BZY88_13335 [SAR202 cluster bacterium Io17-Chloro-G9]